MSALRRGLFKLRGKLGGTAGLESDIPKRSGCARQPTTASSKRSLPPRKSSKPTADARPQARSVAGTLTSVPVSVVVLFDGLQLGSAGSVLPALAPGHNHRSGGNFFAPFLGVIHRLGNAEALAGYNLWWNEAGAYIPR
jgi:hypothetical protein